VFGSRTCANLRPLSPCPRRPHRSLYSLYDYFSNFVQFFQSGPSIFCQPIHQVIWLSPAGVPFDSARRFRASLLLHLHLCAFRPPRCTRLASWMDSKPKKKKKLPVWGGRQTKDCNQTWSFGFQFRLGKHFSDERGLPFYCLKIGFLEYLRISGEIPYPNGPIGCWMKVAKNLEKSQ